MAFTRREFLQANAAVSLGLVAKSSGLGLLELEENSRKVRIGLVGTGNRGNSLLRILLSIPGVEIAALCDIDKERLETAQEKVVEAGQKKPEGYWKDEYAFKNLMDRDDIEAVIIATYWEWHTPMAVYAMKAGKYAGTEVPAAYTLEECWELILMKAPGSPV